MAKKVVGLLARSLKTVVVRPVRGFLVPAFEMSLRNVKVNKEKTVAVYDLGPLYFEDIPDAITTYRLEEHADGHWEFLVFEYKKEKARTPVQVYDGLFLPGP